MPPRCVGTGGAAMAGVVVAEVLGSICVAFDIGLAIILRSFASVLCCGGTERVSKGRVCQRTMWW